jgi:hypothetical protein
MQRSAGLIGGKGSYSGVASRVDSDSKEMMEEAEEDEEAITREGELYGC